MDRRDALLKLGAGAAIGSATVLIQTSPAFAYDSPTILTNPTLAVVTDSNNNRARVNVTRGTATCPASATNQTIRTRTTCTTLVLTPAGRVQRIGMDILPQARNSISFVVRKTESAVDNSGRPYANNDSFRLDIAERHRCIYSDGTQRNTTLTASFVATKSGVGGPWTTVPI